MAAMTLLEARQGPVASPTTPAPATTPAPITSSATTTNDPYFASTYTPTATSATESHAMDLSKTILVLVFSVVAVLVMALFLAYRLLRLRKTGRPLRDVFLLSSENAYPSIGMARPRNLPRTTGLGNTNAGGGTTHIILPNWSLYGGETRGARTRGADVDADGRRAGPDGFGDKEQLPAYDVQGGPPTYFGFEGVNGALDIRLPMQPRQAAHGEVESPITPCSTMPLNREEEGVEQSRPVELEADCHHSASS